MSNRLAEIIKYIHNDDDGWELKDTRINLQNFTPIVNYKTPTYKALSYFHKTSESSTFWRDNLPSLVKIYPIEDIAYLVGEVTSKDPLLFKTLTDASIYELSYRQEFYDGISGDIINYLRELPNKVKTKSFLSMVERSIGDCEKHDDIIKLLQDRLGKTPLRLKENQRTELEPLFQSKSNIIKLVGDASNIKNSRITVKVDYPFRNVDKEMIEYVLSTGGRKNLLRGNKGSIRSASNLIESMDYLCGIDHDKKAIMLMDAMVDNFFIRLSSFGGQLKDPDLRDRVDDVLSRVIPRYSLAYKRVVNSNAHLVPTLASFYNL